MPAVVVCSVTKEDGRPSPIGSMSHTVDDKFLDFRKKLERSNLVPFPFQFVDTLTKSRMPLSCEEFLVVGDYPSPVLVICVDDSTGGANRSSHHGGPEFGSSNASNVETHVMAQAEPLSTNTEGEEPELPLCTEAPLEGDGEDITDTVEQSPIELKSLFMLSEHKKIWEQQAKKLQDYMACEALRDHRWKVRTWDKGETPIGKIFCVECDETFECSKKGRMEKSAITNCFINYTTKHLKTIKHTACFLKNKKCPSSEDDVQKSLRQVIGPDDRAVLKQHVQILEDINARQLGDRATFEVVGDQNRDPLHLSLFKARCYYCAELMQLVQRNLEYNLSQHCASGKHIEAVEGGQRRNTGIPLSSGRPGRPRVADKRDVKQRKIGLFFLSDKADSGQSSRSSSSNHDRGTGEICDVCPLSFLCWGLWQYNIVGSRQARPIKDILLDFRPGGVWYSEANVRASVFNCSSKQYVEIQGTFRHVNCSRVSVEGGGFLDLVCEHCWSIQNQTDFRLRVMRENLSDKKRGTRDTAGGLRLDYMTVPEIMKQARLYSGSVQRERRRFQSMQHRVVMLRARVPNLRELCEESARQKDIQKFCHAIILAHRKGAFGGREALWDLLKDVAFNMNRENQGKRYSKGTKLICQALFHNGGRRVIDCLSSNMIGPSLVTLQRDKSGMTVFQPGLHEEHFIWIAEVYAAYKSRFGIQGLIPCMVAEDETAVKKAVRWLPTSDTLLGFCGKKTNHVCLVGMEIKVGENEEGFKNITDAFEQCVVGHQARVLMVNPLHKDFPRLCLMATSTCNRFDHVWVRKQWEEIYRLWNKHCLKSVGPLLGHASDGDQRRRKLMLEDMVGKVMSERRMKVPWEGWPLGHSMVQVFGMIVAYRLHDQDYIHNLKKLINPLDSHAKILKLGSGVASISHIQLIQENYSYDEHGLTLEDIKRTDRQNFTSAQRLCNRKLIKSLGHLSIGKDDLIEQCDGTEMYLTICADYADIFMNTTLTLRQRVVLCGKVSFFSDCGVCGYSMETME